MKRTFTTITVICLIWSSNILQAQTEYEQAKPDIPKPYFVHELSAYVAGGVSNIGYKLADGSRSGGAGFGAGINYAYNLSYNFAIVSGLGFTTYSGKLTLDEYSESYSSIDDRGDPFTLTYSFNSEYSEKQSVALLSIPVMARYSMPLGTAPMKFFASGGIKLAVPLVAKATITSGTVSTTGYYEYEARTYDDLPEHGFVNGHSGEQTGSRIRLGVTPLLSLETGLRIPTGYKTALTAGLYLDYSPVNVQRSNDRHIIEYQSLSPMQFNYNSALNTAMVNKITLFTSGVKIGIIL